MGQDMGMHLKKVSFTDQQMKWFEGMSKRTGISLAELVRRCVDHYIEEWSKLQTKKI